VRVPSGPSLGERPDNWTLAADSATITPPVDYGETRPGTRSSAPVELASTFAYRIELYIGSEFFSYGGWLQP